MSKRSDRPRVQVRVTPQGLAPLTRYDADLLSAYPMGAEVEAEIFQRKSNPQLRLYWSILQRVAENTPFDSAEALSKALLIHLKHVASIKLVNGDEVLEPRSLRDFDKQALSRFFDEAIRVIASEVIPGLDIKALIDEGRLIVGSVP
jgi:hypothetical protein